MTPGYWRDEDGNLFGPPEPLSPALNLAQAMVIVALVAGILTYAAIAWWL